MEKPYQMLIKILFLFIQKKIININRDKKHQKNRINIKIKTFNGRK